MISPRLKKWIFSGLRWAVAIVGVYLILSSLHIADRVVIFDSVTQRPVDTTVEAVSRTLGNGTVEQVVPPENTWPLKVRLPDGSVRDVSRTEALIRPERTQVVRKSDGAVLRLLFLEAPDVGGAETGVQGTAPIQSVTTPTRLLVAETKSGPAFWLSPAELSEPYVIAVQFLPREMGLARMLRGAKVNYLLLSLAVIPGIYLLTGYRWWLLLRSLGVPIRLGIALQINMVGAFYNTFLPGSTGGDVLKAYYAAKLAKEFRTRAILTVVIDRAIGLLALIIMGGFAAAMQWDIPECRQIAIGALIIISGLTLAVMIGGYTPARKALGVDWIIGKLPLQEKVAKLIDALRVYRSNGGLIAATLLMSFPVHATIVLSATFAAWAFSLPLAWNYYWVVVPTVVLSGALPISPQGAGVMEAFAVLLTRPKGATVGQAVALTMSIRLVQVFWNLACGIFVLKGGFHAPTAEEQAELEAEQPPVGK